MKRFFAKDMRTALAEVKDVLGADAVIMSSKKVAGGIEIVAGVDDHVAPIAQPTPSLPQESSQRLTMPSQASRSLDDDTVNLSSFRNKLAHLASAGKKSAAPSTATESDSLQHLLKRQEQQLQQLEPQVQPAASNSRLRRPQKELNPAFAAAPSQPQAEAAVAAATQQADQTQQELSALKQEMLVMRQLLEHQVSGLMKQEMERSEPMRAMLVKQLVRMGIAEELAEQFACYIDDGVSGREAWAQLQTLLAEQIVVTDDEILRQGGVVALVGPTGVGKTTTIAKIAARFAAQYGADQVALISCDSYRIGAMAQLATYARILGCPIRNAKNSDELSEQLHQLRHHKLILIDTAGMGQRDMRLNEQLNTLITTSRVKIKSYLVLPATAQRVVMQEAIEQFRKIPLRGCIFTKLDECLSLGECVSVAIQNALPIGYLSDGQRVPEDLRVADPAYLVKQVMSLATRRKTKGAPQGAKQAARVRL